MLTRRTRVYVSGPLTGSGDREENVAGAIAVGDRLLTLGYAPLIPHLSHFWEVADERHQHEHAEWLAMDRSWVIVSDCVLRLPGESAGADQECAVAKECNVPVYGSLSDLLRVEPTERPRDGGKLEVAAVVPGLDPEQPLVTNDRGGKQSTTPYRPDLIPPRAIMSVSHVLAEGAKKYAIDNWRLISAREHLGRALAHAFAWLAGDRSDDHAGHMACRSLMFCELAGDESSPKQ